MSRIHLALTVGALVIASAALITWRSRHGSHSPLGSLQELGHAVQTRDRRGIEQFLDVRRAAESVVDEAVSTAGAPGDADSAMKPSLVSATQQAIWSMLIDSLATLEARYEGLADVQQHDGVARIGLRIRSPDGDSSVVVHLRMEPAAGGGHWRIVGVEDLGPYMRLSFERKLERAYETAMRSDLRNLVTAQEMYFTGHGTYSPSLQALTYAPSPGVRIEIITTSGRGWRAVARHESATVACRIGVGTGVTPGDVEREVKCSAPR